MPTETLIASLTDLRETYMQRQRAASSLMTALKGTTSALSKTSRLLNDYARQNGHAVPAALAGAQQAFADLQLKDEVIDPLVPDLRRELKSLTGLTTALKEALAALQGETVDVVRLGRAYQALQATKLAEPALTALLPELERAVQSAQQSLGVTFGQALRDAFADLGVAVGGRPPRFEIGRFEVSANFVNRTAALSYGKEEVVRAVPLSVEAVIRAYQREAKAIMGRNEDGGRWMEQFYLAWENARRRRSTTDQRANVVDCYLELVLLRQPRIFRSAPSKRRFADYSRAQFAYDLFEFADRQRREHKGLRVFAHTATKSQVDNPERSIWIVEDEHPHSGRYVADIVFARDE